MDYIGLGRRVRGRRKALGLTQAALAERAGISLAFLGHIERGTRKASLETLVALCRALMISPAALLVDTLPACDQERPSAQVRAALNAMEGAFATLKANLS